jgi:hypothetical protein
MLRRVLGCDWRQVPATGKLECFWRIEMTDPERPKNRG